MIGDFGKGQNPAAPYVLSRKRRDSAAKGASMQCSQVI
jgi:hypothetical protein